MRWVFPLVVSACSYSPRAIEEQALPDGPGVTPDTTSVTPFVVAHVSAADEATLTSTAIWTVATATTIDTDAGASQAGLPADLHVALVDQDGGGPQLFVVQAATVEITARLTAIGSHPLVVIATDEIAISASGSIDVSADHARPGAGGALPSEGSGAGGDASSNGSAQDSGGGGASFGTAGAAGGAGTTGSGAVAPAGTVGPIYGTPELATLEGGSGGGNHSPTCSDKKGGAGGGAVQLTAARITLDGVVHAGGGGAMIADVCNSDGLGGGGGGSGGAIYLETAMLSGAGMLAANGGGGSGTASFSSGQTGDPGENGHPDNSPAAGGAGAFGFGGAGATNAAAIAGGTDDNGGGGGGGAGRIAISAGTTGTQVASSPTATRL